MEKTFCFIHFSPKLTILIAVYFICSLVDGLRTIFSQNVFQIILYGSVARQEENSESDIDIAIIINETAFSAVRSQFIEWNSELDMNYNRVFSIVNIDKSQMDKWGNVLSFYKKIKEEGIVLWQV